MAIDKLKKSRLTFDLSAKVAHIGVPSILKHNFSETIRPIELNFHLKTPYDKLAIKYPNYSGHMTKMADMPIYAKNPLKIFFSRTRRPITWDLVCSMGMWGLLSLLKL